MGQSATRFKLHNIFVCKHGHSVRFSDYRIESSCHDVAKRLDRRYTLVPRQSLVDVIQKEVFWHTWEFKLFKPANGRLVQGGIHLFLLLSARYCFQNPNNSVRASNPHTVNGMFSKQYRYSLAPLTCSFCGDLAILMPGLTSPRAKLCNVVPPSLWDTNNFWTSCFYFFVPALKYPRRSIQYRG